MTAIAAIRSGIAAAIIATIAINATNAAAAPHTFFAAPGCNDPARDAITMLDVPGAPFQALPNADGCWVFVSFPATATRKPSGVGVLRRLGGKLSLERVVRVDGNPTGMVLTHDGALLIVAAGPRIAFLDPTKLISGKGNAVLGYLDEPLARIGRIYANVTADDKFVFVADENALTISVIDLAKARTSGFNMSSIIGKIPTGTLPIALTFSPDETLMYATSQWAPAELKWPIECKREGGRVDDPTPVNPQGAIHIIDVERAKTDPAHSIISSVPAGCSAVRLVLSPTGDRAYVTARNSNALLAFETSKLRSDPAHALIARIPVGTAPVGIAVIDSGRKVIVTNSNRFAGTGKDQQYLTVVDATKLDAGAGAVFGSIAAGAFPREMRVSADGRTLFLTNFGSSSIEMIDLARLPLEVARKH
ncbi:MAG TPA: YncE family protein [Gemmatimonadaceae bacterium]|nr:YncE family protein [Gemmatimonadaceae bacterium]